METVGTTYEKSEIQVIAEQIYETKGKLQDLKLALEDEKFHAKYIPKRREMAYTQSASRMFYIIILSVIVIFCVISFVSGEVAGPAMGIFMIATGGIAIFCGYIDFILIRQQIAIQSLLHYSFREEKALRYSGEKEITTYQSDEIRSKKKIELLEEEIAQLSDKLENLESKKEKILRKKEETEQLLKEKGILIDPDLAKANLTGRLSLKQEDISSDNIQELFELYSGEEKYILQYLDRLSFRLEEINREIMSIEDNYEKAKTKIVLGVICFILLIIFQMLFSEKLEKLFVLIACIICIAGAFYLDKTCTRPILMYFVEHESKWTSDYAFINNLVPVRYKREELLEVIERNKIELKEIQDKKNALD